MSDARGHYVAIVANPYSGSKQNPQRVKDLATRLRLMGLGPVLMWGRDDLAQAAAAADFTRKYRCVVAAGGDGTLHRVINTQTAVPVAMFPLGTENLFAQQFGHSADPMAFAQMIAEGRTVPMDLGRAGERKWAIVASAGFDAEVVHRLHRWRTAHRQHLRRVRRISYLPRILAATWGYRFPMMKMEADGRELRGALCMVFNLPRYGLGFKICPDASGEDELLDYVVMERPGRLPLMGYALAAQRGTLRGKPGICSGRAATIRITCQEPVPLELDGEEAGFAPVEFTCLPAALRVMIPSPPKQPISESTDGLTQARGI